MEKAAKSKSKLFSFLPKTASLSFKNPLPYSPSREKRLENPNKFKSNTGKGFSGPIISMIPAEARTKMRTGSFHSQEPTSPKVSCIGQVKRKKKLCKAKQLPLPPQPRVEKKPSFAIRNILKGIKMSRGSKESTAKIEILSRAPSLGQIKRFSSGRNAFADFDWKSSFGVVAKHRGYYSDEEREESDDEEDDVVIPYSAPMKGGGGLALQPRKEVNLWKRRTMAPPMPLNLN